MFGSLFDGYIPSTLMEGADFMAEEIRKEMDNHILCQLVRADLKYLLDARESLVTPDLLHCLDIVANSPDFNEVRTASQTIAALIHSKNIYVEDAFTIQMLGK